MKMAVLPLVAFFACFLFFSFSIEEKKPQDDKRLDTNQNISQGLLEEPLYYEKKDNNDKVTENVLSTEIESNVSSIVKSDMSLKIESEELQEPLDLIESELKSTAEGGNWNDFLVAANQNALSGDFLISDALLMAIRYEAPLWVIEDLLYSGATFNVEHVIEVAKGNNVDLLIEMEKLGLDIHLFDNEKGNAIFSAISQFKHRKMFSHLIYSGVDIHRTVNGVDPLELALSGTTEPPDNFHGNLAARIRHVTAVFYTRILLEYRAEVKDNHIDLLMELKAVNYRAFIHIIQTSPNLCINDHFEEWCY